MEPEKAEQYVFLVGTEAAGRRADQFLAAELPAYSRSRIQELMKNGDILLGGQPVKSGRRLEAGDELSCVIPAPAELALAPEPMDLAIVYEDAHLLVVNKPQGLVVHPAPGAMSGTLVHGLLAHCRDLSGINGVLRPGIVHRLDKETSGLLVVAKNDAAHRSLAGQILDASMKRQYLALVWGQIDEVTGLVDAPIGRDPRDRQKMAAVAGGKEAQTSYQVLDRLRDMTALQCELHTGRTHQIRVHMQLLGHPVVGDRKYGRRKALPIWDGQALHAWRLEFSHPANGGRMVFFAPPPAGFQLVLRVEQAFQTLARIEKLAKASSSGCLGESGKR